MFGAVPMRYSRSYREQTQDTFGGYDHRSAAGDGTIYDDCNMCADGYPALTVRPLRGVRAAVAKPNGFLAWGGLVWVDGGKLMVDGVEAASLTDSRKLLAGIQDKICIWPDKKIYDRATGELTDMEAVWEGEADFSDGTYAGEPALANTITVAGDLTGLFRAEDGVAVTVRSTEDKTYGAYVIQEIEYDEDTGKTELRFLEETWREFVQEAETAAEGTVNPFPGVGRKLTVRIHRRAPELEGAFEHHNRIWGWHGGTVCCCKLGDPSNWESFNGDSTDSWELQTGSPGCLTGGISYGGRPVFFKERRVIRIYGDYPQQYATSETESLGVEAGSGRSLAVAGDTLYYKSTEGIMAYTGGYPWSVAAAFGGKAYRNAVAGSSGEKYYVFMEDAGGESYLFVYDTRHNLWHREDGDQVLGCGWSGNLYALQENGYLWSLDGVAPGCIREDGITSIVETADYTAGSTRKKTPGRLVLRLEVSFGVDLKIWIRYDSRGDWILLRQLKGEMVKGQEEIVIPLRRCDHYRLRFDAHGAGEGKWTLHSLTREQCVGSNRK